MLRKMTITFIAVFTMVLLSGSAFAANRVSAMATEKRGRHVAECAQMMERGVSACATGSHSCTE